MTNVLHASGQEQATGNGMTCPELGLVAQSLVVSVTAISLNLLGSVSFKVQHSADDSEWFDVPGLATGNLNSTGKTTIFIDPAIALMASQRVVWTFNNANSVTFAAYLTGTK